jgi:hypothetical protein
MVRLEPASLEAAATQVGNGLHPRARQSSQNPNGIQIFQPSVATQRLRWVSIRQKSSTLKGLNPLRTVMQPRWG